VTVRPIGDTVDALPHLWSRKSDVERSHGEVLTGASTSHRLLGCSDAYRSAESEPASTATGPRSTSVARSLALPAIAVQPIIHVTLDREA
jgi:hypothetical protein